MSSAVIVGATGSTGLHYIASGRGDPLVGSVFDDKLLKGAVSVSCRHQSG